MRYLSSIPFVVSCCSLLLFSGCSGWTLRDSARPASYPIGFVERGIASWYGPKFHGRRTANGEVYNMYGMTAAHRTLPLGSIVKVRSLSSGRTVTVRINDRGPFIRGRVLDLSLAGAKALGMVGEGTDEIELRVLGFQGKNSPGLLRVQVAAFSDQASAQHLAEQLRGQHPGTRVTAAESPDGTIYRVQVGEFSNETKAQAVANHLSNILDTDPFIVRDDS